MKDVFLKDYLQEDDFLSYYHFQDDWAIRQLIISHGGKWFLTLDNTIVGNYMLCDQPLHRLDVRDEDFITREEFERVWNDR